MLQLPRDGAHQENCSSQTLNTVCNEQIQEGSLAYKSRKGNLMRTRHNALGQGQRQKHVCTQPSQVLRIGPINKRSLETMIVDSGESEHVAQSLYCFRDLQDTDELKLELAEGSIAKASIKRRVDIQMGNRSILLSNVHFIPSLRSGILSCSKLGENRISTTNARGKCTLTTRKDNNRIL